MTQRIPRSAGFSLLELIVVIGIIAILVSIAVPNYQEALNRSKVAKFQLDAKTIEGALEVYRSDFEIYPQPDQFPVRTECSGWFSPPGNPGDGYVSRRLTTPIGYLAKVPTDFFRNREEVDPCLPERRPMILSNDETNVRVFSGTYHNFYVSKTYEELRRNVMGEIRTFREGLNPAIWFVNSPGPDEDKDHGDGFAVRYDPTNGIDSDGDLFLFGPGLGFAEDF